MPKVCAAKRGTNEWKLFKYLHNHSYVTSRGSKYPPLEIMDLPKLVSALIKQGYRFEKRSCTGRDTYGNAKRWVEYKLTEEVDLLNG